MDARINTDERNTGSRSMNRRESRTSIDSSSSIRSRSVNRREQKKATRQQENKAVLQKKDFVRRS